MATTRAFRVWESGRMTITTTVIGSTYIGAQSASTGCPVTTAENHHALSFISWIMQTAGVSKDLFPPSSAHRLYLNRLLANAHDPFAVFMPHTIQQYKPQPGDLICATRSKVDLKNWWKLYRTHSTRGCIAISLCKPTGEPCKPLAAMFSNSASKTILTLSPDGYLQYAGQRPWFLIIENRLD